ncbi:hypothetical protein ACODYM_29005 [Burkholderia gladioli]|uniref:hypothetical protein n=1 Tax=Burkholderia gladioli TaxID=28095 RepID=UPI003B506645
MTESEIQEKCRLFVRQHVVSAVTMLIGELHRNYDAARALDVDEEELRDLCVQEDYREPVEDFLRSDWSREQLVEALEDAGFMDVDQDKEALISKYLEHLDTEDELEEFARDHSINPYTIEAYEHWIVSDELAMVLEDKGEMVNRDFLGMCVWGRATTGQAILLDGVIREIVNDWPRPIFDVDHAAYEIRALRNWVAQYDAAMSASGDPRVPTGEDYNHVRETVLTTIDKVIANDRSPAPKPAIPRVELPWSDCKVAFGIDCDPDAVWSAFGTTGNQRGSLPAGWQLNETDASGARAVAIFRVDHSPRAADGQVVCELLERLSSPRT